MDNYLISFYDFKKTPLILFKGQITDIHGHIPARVQITIRDIETGIISGTYLADSSGKYSIILPAGKNHGVTLEAKGYLFHSENIDLTGKSDFYEMHNTIQLVPCEPGFEIVLNNIFFAPGKAVLSSFSIYELSDILNLLREHPGLNVEISYRMQTPGKKTKENAALSLSRARAIADYLSANGIQKDRMEAKGYGKIPKGRSESCELRITGVSPEKKVTFDFISPP